VQKPDDAPFRGVEGEGCKNTRRHTRKSDGPINNIQDFCQFLYGQPKSGSPIYLEILSRLSKNNETFEEPCVFTHRDIHMENIVVLYCNSTEKWRLSGVLDWEISGFYPIWYESIQATNNLSTNEYSDWYSYLPTILALQRQPLSWLLDRLYDIYIS